MSDTKHYIVRTPLFPLYSEVKALLGILDGVAKEAVHGMIQSHLESSWYASKHGGLDPA